jgi:hypothetical protein
MKSLLIALLIVCSAHATIYMNSSELLNMSGEFLLNDTLEIVDLNLSIIPDVQNITVIENCTYNQSEYTLDFNETWNCLGNCTSSCPALPVDLEHQELSVTPGNSIDVLGNATVSCSACSACPDCNTTQCGTPVQFHETKSLGFNETVSHSFNQSFCNVSWNYSTPEEPECEAEIVEVQASVDIDAYRDPGECYEKDEGNISVKVCCHTAEPVVKEIQQTLYDLGDIDRDKCDNPLYSEARDEWMCLDELGQFCSADLALEHGAAACCEYAVDTCQEDTAGELKSRENDIKDCIETVSELRADVANKTGVLGGYREHSISSENQFLNMFFLALLSTSGIGLVAYLFMERRPAIRNPIMPGKQQATIKVENPLKGELDD